MTELIKIEPTDEELMDFRSNYLAFQRGYQPVKIEKWETEDEPKAHTEFKLATRRHLRIGPHHLVLDKRYLRADPLYCTLLFYANRGKKLRPFDRTHLQRLADKRLESLAMADDPWLLVEEAFVTRAESRTSFWKKMRWPYPPINPGEYPRRLIL